MKRDKEWFKKQHQDVWNDFYSNLEGMGKLRDRIEDLIEQLDEPEKVIIPQEAADWIKSVRNLSNSMSCLMTYDQIKRSSHELTLWCYESGNNDNLHKLARAWLDGFEVEKEKLYLVSSDENSSANNETFARAWLDGFTVEKEKKYYVLDSEDIPLLERVNDRTYKTTTPLSIYETYMDKSQFALTEKEIKDYDERFWTFAQPVEVTE